MKIYCVEVQDWNSEQVEWKIITEWGFYLDPIPAQDIVDEHNGHARQRELERHAAMTETIKRRQIEYDALTSTGIEPSFARPDFVPWEEPTQFYRLGEYETQ